MTKEMSLRTVSMPCSQLAMLPERRAWLLLIDLDPRVCSVQRDETSPVSSRYACRSVPVRVL